MIYNLTSGTRRTLTRLVTIFLISFLIFSAFPLGTYADEIDSDTVSGSLSVSLDIPADTLEPYLKKFQEKYPRVSLKYETRSNYDSEISKELDLNTVEQDVITIPSSFPAGKLYNHFLKYDDLSEMQKHYKYMSLSANNKNVVYGVPAYMRVYGFIYNKRIFREAGIQSLPESPSKFIDCLHDIDTRTNAIPLYVDLTDNSSLKTWCVFPFIEMTGDASYKYNRFLYTRNPFSEGQNIFKVYNMLYYAVKRGYTEPEPKTGSFRQACTMLNSGKAALLAGDSEMLQNVIDAGKNGDDIGFMPFPNRVNGVQYSTISAGPQYGININTQNPKASKAFVKFMIDESGLAEDTANVSVKKTSPLGKYFENFTGSVITSSDPGSVENTAAYEHFLSGIDFEDTSFAREVINTALGESRYKSFTQLMMNANKSWESRRSAKFAANAGNTGNELWSENNKDSKVKVILSESESAFLKRTPIITVGYVDSNEPYIFKRENKVYGLVPDILSFITKETGLQFHYTEFDNRLKLVNALNRGEIDVSAYEPDTEKVRQQTNPYGTYSLLMIYGKDFDRNNLSANTEVKVTGQTFTYLARLHNTIYADNPREAVKQVLEGKGDYTILNNYTGSCMFSLFDSPDIHSEPVTFEGNAAFGFSGKAAPEIRSIINKYLMSLPDSTKESMLLVNMEARPDFSLKRYFAQHPMLVVAISTSVALLVIAIVLVFSLLAIHSSKSRTEHDPLTGVYNREGLHRYVEKRSKKYDVRSMAFFIFDLDNFKSVNDTLGHAGGDAVLKFFAEIINRFDDPDWVPARIGGDEFVAVAINHDEAFLRHRIEFIIRELDREFRFNGMSHHISASCGGVLASREMSLEEGYHNADTVLYKRKRAGKNGYYFLVLPDKEKSE